MSYSLFETDIGVCGIAWSENGVTRMQLPQADADAAERRLRANGAGDPARPSPAVQAAIAQIVRYARGERADFAAVTLDLAGAAPFERSVYDVARAVGWGETITYGEIARRIGAPREAQAVGQALGHNPIPIIIPCHRVVASGGKLGGFSAFGGRFTKDRLLALEGIGRAGDEPLLPGIVAPAGGRR